MKNEIQGCNVIGLLGGKFEHTLDLTRRVYDVNAVAPTITTCGGGNTEPKIMEEKGYRFYNQAWETIKNHDCKQGDIVDAFNKKVNDSGISPTITTRPEGFKTAILLVDKALNKQNLAVWDGFNQKVRKDSDTIGTLTGNCHKDLKRNGQGIIEKDNDRIRKLTERECGRLMGVKDDDISKIGKNLSRSAQYHMFGDSIVTSCLMAIFGKMFNVDYESKIKELTKKITGEG